MRACVRAGVRARASVRSNRNAPSARAVEEAAHAHTITHAPCSGGGGRGGGRAGALMGLRKNTGSAVAAAHLPGTGRGWWGCAGVYGLQAGVCGDVRARDGGEQQAGMGAMQIACMEGALRAGASFRPVLDSPQCMVAQK
jgi:hypothetical protein